MKLKLVVASMSVLGLISCPVFADTQAKHKHHHHRHHHHAVMSETVVKGEYKDMGALPVVETCPVVNTYTMMLDSMSQNVGRAKPTLHCMDPISFAGGINFDAHWGNRHFGYTGENPRRLALNDAYVNVYGNVNDWTQAFMSLSYAEFSPTGANAQSMLLPGLYSNSYNNGQIQLEQGFITFKNPDVTPFFGRLGKMFVPFGRYEIHAITRTLTQTLTESLNTSAQVGFMVPMGFYGSVFGFNNPVNLAANAHRRMNYGADLGFAHYNDQLGWDVGLGYLYNFTGINDVAAGIGVYNGTGPTGTTLSRVSAGTVYGDLNSGPFSLAVRYASGFSRFNVVDLGNATTIAASSHGAKPWAADITGGYRFNVWSKDQNIYLGYQASGDAAALFLPKSRWTAGYGIDVLKNTNVGVQFYHDTAYSSTLGGLGRSSNSLAARASVLFG